MIMSYVPGSSTNTMTHPERRLRNRVRVHAITSKKEDSLPLHVIVDISMKNLFKNDRTSKANLNASNMSLYDVASLSNTPSLSTAVRSAAISLSNLSGLMAIFLGT